MSKTKDDVDFGKVRSLAGRIGFFTELLPVKYRDAFVNLVIDVAEMEKVAEDAPVAWAVVRQVAHAVAACGLPSFPTSQNRPATPYDLGPDVTDAFVKHLPLDVLAGAAAAWRKRHTFVVECHPHCHPITPPEDR